MQDFAQRLRGDLAKSMPGLASVLEKDRQDEIARRGVDPLTASEEQAWDQLVGAVMGDEGK